MSGFRIAALRVGSGELGLCPIPGRAGDYEGDLAALLRWRPAMVLTMTTRPELDSTGAGSLGDDLRGHGIAWRHLPIEDFGAPSGEAARLWPQVAAEALAHLETGARILAHCYGGCGRSGMAVLRLMIEAGEVPASALLRLRAARPCAVETEAQRAWAYAGAT